MSSREDGSCAERKILAEKTEVPAEFKINCTCWLCADVPQALGGGEGAGAVPTPAFIALLPPPPGTMDGSLLGWPHSRRCRGHVCALSLRGRVMVPQLSSVLCSQAPHVELRATARSPNAQGTQPAA